MINLFRDDKGFLYLKFQLPFDLLNIALMAFTFQCLEASFTLEMNQWLDYGHYQLEESNYTNNKDNNLSKSEVFSSNSKNIFKSP